MHMTPQKALNLAIEVAKESKERHKIGAILFDKSKYVVSANRTFSVMVTGRSTPYSEHAEAAVINHGLHVGIDINKSTLIVVRVNKAGNLMLAHPCRHCKRLIESVNIPKILYSNDPLRRELISDNFKSLGEL